MRINKKIIAIIPARGSSKRLPKKNIKLLAGKPLISYTIEEAKKSNFINRILVSTEDKKIEKISKKYGVEVIKRPKKLAINLATTEDVIKHVVSYLENFEKYYPDIIIILQPTSPLRNVKDIDSAIEKFLKTKCDSIVSLCEISHYRYWMFLIKRDKLIPFVKSKSKSNLNKQKIFQLNGAIYIMNRDTIMNQDKIRGKITRGYIMPPERSIDIDSEVDFKLAEFLIRKKR